MKRADMSMYEAKIFGKNALRFFDPRMQLAVQERFRLEEEIRLGLTNGEFILNFQPQMEQTEGIIGAESMVGWKQQLRGQMGRASCRESGVHKVEIWMFAGDFTKK